MTLHQALLRAELDGEISELQALLILAILTPEAWEEYLEMALVVIRSPGT